MAREELEWAEDSFEEAGAAYARADEDIRDFLWETEEAAEAFETGPQDWDDIGHEAPDDLWDDDDDGEEGEGSDGDGAGEEGEVSER